MANRNLYTIGIKLESNEHYDRLRKNHSSTTLFGLNFDAMFDGYPDEYPTLVQYVVDNKPFGFMYSTQLNALVDDGYKIVIEKEMG